MKVMMSPGQLFHGDVRLVHCEAGCGDLTPILFVHGWGGDGGHFRHQQQHFSTDRCTVAVDLRGHGASSAPPRAYNPDTFAEDLIFVCERLKLAPPIVVGHSMGGNIALRLAARAPQRVRAIVMIDTLIEAEPALREQLLAISAGFDTVGGPDALAALLSAMLFLPSDDAELRTQIVAQCARTPRHVLKAAFDAHLLGGSSLSDLRGLVVPAAFIGADGLPTDPGFVTAINPRVMTGKTIGVGHYSPLLAPRQINAMLATFLARLEAPREAHAVVQRPAVQAGAAVKA
jgi:pimeloyl-ACP methyl ester carboxylesterase